MKRKLGITIAKVGAHLWENGGWTDEGQYKDLKITGKLGYHLVCRGLGLMGITPDNIDKVMP